MSENKIDWNQQADVVNGIDSLPVPKVEYEVEKSHVVLLTLANGETGLFYSANVLHETKEIFKRKVEKEKAIKEYWRSRSEDIQTYYNLQTSTIERFQKEKEEYEEKIKLLSEALTRSKHSERGKAIQITKLKNANSRRKRVSR